MCEGLPRAAGPRPSGDPHRERGWRSEPRGSPPPAPDPASAQPGLDAGAVRAERRRDADRRWPVRRARPGTRGPGHRAGCLRARRSGSSPRPPAGQRAVGLQGSDLGFQQLALEQHRAQFGFEPLGLQRLAIGGPRRETGLTGRHKGVPPSRQSRGGDAQRPREDLQILPPQQAYHPIALALARHPPTAAQTHAARSCCLRLHHHPPADHVRLQSVSANRGAHQKSFSFFGYGAIGLSIGLRFSRHLLRRTARALPEMLAGTFALIGLCGVSAWILVRVLHIDALTAYLATSPGGLDSVAIIAVGSHADVPFVLAIQTLRLFLIILVGPPLARLIARAAPAGGVQRPR